MSELLATSRAALVGLASVLLVLACHAGDALVYELHAGVGHHALHILLPLVAFVIFSGLVARDVQRHGWPAFSWRL